MKLIKVFASVEGASHKRKNIICQDASLVKVLEDDIVVAAVADGHGSSKCKFSFKGAQIAVECFFRMIKTYSDKSNGNYEELVKWLRPNEATKFVKDFHSLWKKEVDKSYIHLKKRDADLREVKDVDYELFGTTFLGLVVTHEFRFALQIGDGDISYVTPHGCQSVIEADKFLGTETYSLSDDMPWKYSKTFFQRANYDDIVPALFMLSSDGFANSFKNDEQYKVACIDYFNTICKYGQDVVQQNLEGWLSQTSEEGCGDDISLVVVGWVNDEENPSITEKEGD